MRIARLAGEFRVDARGGLNPNLCFVSKAQAEQGHEVKVFALTKGTPRSTELEGFTIQWVRKPPAQRWLGGIALLEAVRKSGFKPDVVHAHQLVPLGYFFGLARKKVPANYALSLHNSIFAAEKSCSPDAGSWLDSVGYGILARKLAHEVGLVLPIAEFIKRELTRAGVPESRIKVVRTGVDFARFNGVAGKRVRGKQFQALYAGRFVRKKGLTHLVRALKLLEKEPVEMVLVGGRESENDYRNVLAEIRRQGVEKRVRVLPSRPYAELPKLYAEADAFVLPSLHEPTGKVMLEAMAAGVPVIATRQGGPRELIESGFNGLLVEPGNAQEIANAVRALMRDEGLAAELSKNGVETAKKLDWKEVAAAYTRAFEEAFG